MSLKRNKLSNGSNDPRLEKLYAKVKEVRQKGSHLSDFCIMSYNIDCNNIIIINGIIQKLKKKRI